MFFTKNQPTLHFFHIWLCCSIMLIGLNSFFPSSIYTQCPIRTRCECSSILQQHAVHQLNDWDFDAICNQEQSKQHWGKGTIWFNGRTLSGVLLSGKMIIGLGAFRLPCDDRGFLKELGKGYRFFHLAYLTKQNCHNLGEHLSVASLRLFHKLLATFTFIIRMKLGWMNRCRNAW